MNLTTFNTINTVASSGRKSEPRLYIDRGGCFKLNKVAADLIGLSADAHLEVSQDNDRPVDWYISLSDNKDGFLVRTAKEGRDFLFNNSDVRKRILTSLGKDPSITKAVSLPIGATMVDGKYWPIMTSALKK